MHLSMRTSSGLLEYLMFMIKRKAAAKNWKNTTRTRKATESRALKQRSIDGTNPTTREIGPVASSSQFKSWKMQLHAINKAIGRMQGNAPSPTGFDGIGNPVVVVELPGAGRGYKPNSKDVNNPRHIENMNRAEIIFDRNNITKPFTAFPK